MFCDLPVIARLHVLGALGVLATTPDPTVLLPSFPNAAQ